MLQSNTVGETYIEGGSPFSAVTQFCDGEPSGMIRLFDLEEQESHASLIGKEKTDADSERESVKFVRSSNRPRYTQG